MAMSPPSTVHGGQHDIKYVTYELLLHAAFVADAIGVLCLNLLVGGGFLYRCEGLERPQ